MKKIILYALILILVPSMTYSKVRILSGAGGGDVVTDTTPQAGGPFDLNGNPIFDATGINDDDCTGQQGYFWWDSTDTAWEFCDANSGTPITFDGYQPLDSELSALAGLASAANAIPYFTGSGTAGVISSSANMISLLGSADYATARTNLGLAIGTDINAKTFTTGQTTDADPYTVTKTANKEFEITEITLHADNVTLQASENNAEDGDYWLIVSVDGTNNADMVDISAQQELKGNMYFPAAEHASILLQYITDRWTEVSRSTSVDYFSSMNIAGGLLTFDRTRAVPQSVTYDDDDDLNQTYLTDLTSSVILVTGDNDTDNDSIDLQDGVSAGDQIEFIAVALVDADDTFTIDAETDSTCTGCPNSGILVMDEVGDSYTLYWTGTFWQYQGGRDAD